MSRAVLVMDMPDSCMGCNFMHIDEENDVGNCQEVNRLKADLEKQKNRSSRKQTNADRIREMSDEELMKIIMCPYDISGIPVNMMPCVRNGNIQELIPPEECNKCMMEWLQSEV